MKRNKANILIQVSQILRIEFTLVKRTKKGTVKRILPNMIQSKIENLVVSNPGRKQSKDYWTSSELSSTIKSYMQNKGWIQLQDLEWKVGTFYLEVSIFVLSASLKNASKIKLVYIEVSNFIKGIQLLVTVSRERGAWRYIISKGCNVDPASLSESNRSLLEHAICNSMKGGSSYD